MALRPHLLRWACAVATAAALHGGAQSLGTPGKIATNAPPRNSNSFDLRAYGVAGGILYYQGLMPDGGFELWRSDGTAAGTLLVADIAAGDAESRPAGFTAFGADVLFSADDKVYGMELWKTGGTAQTTTRVTDLWTGPPPSNVRAITNVSGTAYFSAWNSAGEGLWKSDGTTAGTLLLEQGLSFASGFTAVNGAVVFAAADGASGVELWRSDGTPAGTTLLKEIYPGSFGSEPRGFAPVGNVVLFVAESPEGVELWRTDGTAAGTTMVRRIPVAAPNGVFGTDRFTVLAGVAYFQARDAQGAELWRSDGTEGGTYRVADICPGPCESGPFQFVTLGGVLYFVANDGTHGWELWRSDGTEAGTRMVRDIGPAAAIYPYYLTVAGGRLYFVAQDEAHGEELWTSDGTAAGTRLYVDITPGAASTEFAWLAASSEGLFFATQWPDALRFDLWHAAIQPVFPGDRDGDGIPDGVEAEVGTDPNVKDNDVFANARLFAMQQYRDFLGREGDAAGIGFWSGQVSSGARSRGQVAKEFLESGEFQGSVAPVARLYFAYFLRPPDYSGLTFWVNHLRAGNSLDSISNAFAGSAEFTQRYGGLDNGQFVDLVYNNVLGRAPDPGGRAHWVGQLDSDSMTRGQVMKGFSESPEYQALTYGEVFVTMAYMGMLRRAVDAGGFAFWVDYLDRGNPPLAIIDGILGSSEYRARFMP